MARQSFTGRGREQTPALAGPETRSRFFHSTGNETGAPAFARVEKTTTDVASLPERYDVVLDTVGNVSTASGRRLLADGGVLLLAVADLGETLRARGNVKAGPAPERPDDARELLDLVASGALRVVIDRVVPLDEVVAAHARVDSGRKVGNLVLHP